MLIIALICFLTFCTGIVILLGLSPERVALDVESLLKPRQTIKKRALAACGKSNKNFFIGSLIRIRDALELTGRKGSFGFLCICAFAVIILGFSLAFTFDLYYLIPIALVGGVLLPFFSAESAVETYDRRMNEELETALSVISAAYLRTGDVVGSVGESLENIREPAREIFRQFYVNVTVVSSDTVSCIRKMEQSSENRVFRDWCEVLLACQEDSSNRDALMPVVSELTELRLANSEMVTVITECRKEYLGMVFLTLGNFPLLYLLNESWWDTLINSTAGRCAIAVTGVVLLLTSYLSMKFTRPIDLNSRKK